LKVPCRKNKKRYQPDFDEESVPQPDSVELPAPALPDVAPDGVLDGAVDAADEGVDDDELDGVADAALLGAGELDEAEDVVPADAAEPDGDGAEAAPDVPVVVAGCWVVDDAEPEEAGELAPEVLDEDEDGDEYGLVDDSYDDDGAAGVAAGAGWYDEAGVVVALS
jgi:hypothetical protein